MSPPIIARLSDQILEEATTWFVEFSEGDVDLRQRQHFIGWLRTSPEHIRAYLQIATHWDEARSLGRTSSLTVDELIALARANPGVIVPLVRGDTLDSTSDIASRLPAVNPNRHTGRWVALAACVLASAFVASYWLLLERSTYNTDTGEQRDVTLEDGSTVELNSQSKIRIAFHRNQRDIELIRGQALFQVAKDPTRPFVVHSESTQIRAVGTQFDVYRRKTGTTVTVLEGTVAVTPGSKAPSTPERSPVSADKAKPETPASELNAGDGPTPLKAVADTMLLRAGDQATISARGRMAPRHIGDTSAATAWTHKEIVLKNTPLAEVVTEFNRYNTKPLVILDPNIESIRISGIFSSTNLQSLLRGLEVLGRFNIRETSERVEISSK